MATLKKLGEGKREEREKVDFSARKILNEGKCGDEGRERNNWIDLRRIRFYIERESVDFRVFISRVK